jgi:hypothetical protein
MARSVISPEEGAELERLMKQYPAALEQGAVVLAKKGMDSPEFAAADAATGKLWTRIRELQGMAGKHWMA